MDQEEKRNCGSPLPVLPRLDRLDRLLLFMEERRSSSSPSATHSSRLVLVKMEAEEHCKTMSSAREEVQHKGTLIDRLEMLENRVLQLMSLLSLETEVESTSKSSTSTVLAPEDVGHGATYFQDLERPERSPIAQDSSSAAKAEACLKSSSGQDHGKRRRHKRNFSISRYRKWLARMACAV